MLEFGKIQLRVQHFKRKKLDKMLEFGKPTSCSTFQAKKLSIGGALKETDSASNISGLRSWK